MSDYWIKKVQEDAAELTYYGMIKERLLVMRMRFLYGDKGWEKEKQGN